MMQKPTMQKQRSNRRSSSSKSSQRLRRFGCRFETLESRQMLAADVVISEVMYNVPGSDTGKEYVELYNAGDASINLNGWKIEDDDGHILYTLPSTTLLAGNYLLVASGTNNFAGVSNKVGNTTDWNAGEGLGNNGDSAILKNSSNIVIAELAYEDSSPWPVRSDGDNSSLQIVDRDESAGDRYKSSNWMASREVDGSPGVAGVTAESEVVINEILGNSGVLQDQIELYNLTDKEVDISGWFFSDGGIADLSPAIAANTKIAPFGTISFDQTFLGFGLSSGGQSISLLNSAKTLFIDTVDYRPAENGVSLGRLPDGTGELFPNANRTFGQDNAGHQLSPLVISEIMYHPTASIDENFEFVEIYNRSSTVVNTSNWQLRRDLDSDLTSFNLSPGDRLLVVPFLATDTTKINAFNSHYGVTLASLNVVYGDGAGAVGDRLSNRRAVIELREQVDIDDTATVDLQFVTRDMVRYEDRGDWPVRADGLGSSLDRIDLDGYGNDVTNWRASYDFDGSPGSAGTSQKDIVINEVLAHTDSPFEDTIELFNRSGGSIDIGGWFLTDDFLVLNKYQIPLNTVMPANSYIAFGASDLGFNINGAKGEDLWLTEASGSSVIRFADHVSFGASFNPEAFGRWPNGSGELFPMSDRTLNATTQQVYVDGANSGPIIEDLSAPSSNSFSARVIISEVMYNPDRGVTSDYQTGLNHFEYVELYNRTGQTLSLGQREADDIDGTPWSKTPQGWRLNTAVDYEFPCAEGDAACDIDPFGTVLIVGFDPVAEPSVLSAFRARYGLDNSVKIFGPFEGDDFLDDNGGVLELEAPDLTPGDSTPGDAFTPNVLVDRVSFKNSSPWPSAADGGNMSLTRVAPNAYGDFAASWTAAAPSPGTVPGFDGPRVLDVIVSSSAWSPAFLNEISTNPAHKGYSFDTASAQSTSLPWSRIDQVSIVFDSDVDIQSKALKIRGLNVADYSVENNPTYNPSTHTATWEIDTGSISGDRVIIDLDETKVADADTSVNLDGEWTDGSSAAQSGDGSPGGDFLFRFNVFGGDVDRDDDVQNDDYADLLDAMFSSIGGANYSVEADTDGSGQVTVRDLVSARRRLGSALPGGLPSSPEAPASLLTQVTAEEDTSSTLPKDANIVARPMRSDVPSVAGPVVATAHRRSAVLSRRTTIASFQRASDHVHSTSDDTLRLHRVGRVALRHRFTDCLTTVPNHLSIDTFFGGLGDHDRA